MRLFVGLGVRKLRITGGEPLVRAQLPRFIERLSAYPVEDIALTTNGMLLGRYAAELAQAGLRRITISLDSLRPDVFSQMSGGRGSLDGVLEGIAAAVPPSYARAKRGQKRRYPRANTAYVRRVVPIYAWSCTK